MMNFLAAFFLGLAGSLHCAAMCGPLILAVNAARRRPPPALRPPAGRMFFTILPTTADVLSRMVFWGPFPV